MFPKYKQYKYDKYIKFGDKNKRGTKHRDKKRLEDKASLWGHRMPETVINCIIHYSVCLKVKVKNQVENDTTNKKRKGRLS